MPNIVTLDGVIVNTWSFNDQLCARLCHYGADGARSYFNLVFPDAAILIREVNAQGVAQQRRVPLARRATDRIARSRVVVVTGQLVSRDRKVPLSEFVERAKDGSGLSDTEKATLETLADKIGQEPRAVTEIVVQELVYL